MKDIMFHVPIFIYEFTNWSNKFKEEILSHLEFSPLNKRRKIQTDYISDKKNAPPYKEFILSCIKNKLDDFCLEIQTPRKNLVVIDMWYETANQYEYHALHNHGAYGYSACWYIDFDNTQHTSTVFHSPFINFLNGVNISYQPQVTEGDLVFFPSTIMHENLSNESRKKRTVISFNLSI